MRVRTDVKGNGSNPGTEGSFTDRNRFSVVVREGNHDVNSGPPTTEEEKTSRTTAEFEAGPMVACATPQEAVADPKGQRSKAVAQF